MRVQREGHGQDGGEHYMEARPDNSPASLGAKPAPEFREHHFPPKITNCYIERIEENRRSGCEMGAFEGVQKYDVL
jgi:hypothetical protein